MKKTYIIPEIETIRIKVEKMLEESMEEGGWLGNRRKNAIVEDDEPAASGDEGGYKRTLW